MASQDTTILLAGGTRLSQELISNLRSLAQVRDNLAHIKSVMDATIVGASAPADYAPLEGRFNIASGASAGVNGQATYNLVAGALARLNSPAIDAALSQLVS